jgi:galactose oxidase
VNSFCAGHTFLPDGRLLVVGGHLADSAGVNQAAIYDFETNTWTPTALMNEGRWYPTATTLPDGRILVLAGTFRAADGRIVTNDVLQVWNNGAWSPISNTVGSPLNFDGLPLYPHMHVASNGKVFMSGPLAQTYLLETSGGGNWTPLSNPGGRRINGFRDYCPSVMYDLDKVIYIGGGNDQGTHEPTAEAEIIDLRENPPRWRTTGSMKFRRRQHNATILPDGTVLVTGGTRGGGGPNMGFNDLQPGRPVHAAELWNPTTGTWTELAAESVDRCYHATAVLLPDATVLSAGGGEYRPDNVNPNDPNDSHRNAQVFFPPYLFKGEPPDITEAPTSVTHGMKFDVGTSQPSEIEKVSWVSLPSVTHSLDHNQRLVFLMFQAGSGKLTVTAPSSPNICPPGYYMMFVLTKNGVPSAAKIIQMKPTVVERREVDALSAEISVAAPVQTFARQATVVEAAKGTAVVVGITGTCPYGIGACWGGAYEALSQLEGVELVNPIPNASDSTAEVFLEDERLPSLGSWNEQFRRIVNGTYELRGVEVTVQGILEQREGSLFLAGAGKRPAVRLARAAAEEKIQWNHAVRARKPLEKDELAAYDNLMGVAKASATGQRVTITGPLRQTEGGYELYVRLLHP